MRREADAFTVIERCLQRACETSIDLAMHVISRRRLGIPQDSRNAFTILQTSGILPAGLTVRMQHMAGFLKIAVHEYTHLNVDVVRSIISKQLGDFRLFSSTILKAFASPTGGAESRP
jgi:uncharacterized protein YutE (UPF0331/DUF86 family)